MAFPSDFVDNTQPLAGQLDDAVSKEAIESLAAKGFEVHAGLTIGYAVELQKMTHEPGIKEYCPKDSSQRFADEASIRAWLAKQRAAFLLLQRTANDLRLAGYGWAGLESSDHVPGGKTTFAIRVGERGQGQGLAVPFAQLIINASVALYDAEDFWLETWASNGGAVHVYHKLGFEDVDQVPGQRPTTSGGMVADTRLFMRLPA